MTFRPPSLVPKALTPGQALRTCPGSAPFLAGAASGLLLGSQAQVQDGCLVDMQHAELEVPCFSRSLHCRRSLCVGVGVGVRLGGISVLPAVPGGILMARPQLPLPDSGIPETGLLVFWAGCCPLPAEIVPAGSLKVQPWSPRQLSGV